MKYDSKKDTLAHIEKVQEFIGRFNSELSERGINHDSSKLSEEEKSYFDIYTPKLKDCTFGSDEYKTYLKELDIALRHHYRHNSHHPEFHKNGIKDMSLVDIVEMLCDWKSATLRHNNGDLIRSIEINQDRFKYSDELKSIMLNEAKSMYKYRIDFYCVDGRRGTALGDTVDKVYENVSKLNLADSEKSMLIKGVYGEDRQSKDFYNNHVVLDNCFGIEWKIQY